MGRGIRKEEKKMKEKREEQEELSWMLGYDP
jgi:hypothetical protein